jgi:hypothetical protein
MDNKTFRIRLVDQLDELKRIHAVITEFVIGRDTINNLDQARDDLATSINRIWVDLDRALRSSEKEHHTTNGGECGGIRYSPSPATKDSAPLDPKFKPQHEAKGCKNNKVIIGSKFPPGSLGTKGGEARLVGSILIPPEVV